VKTEILLISCPKREDVLCLFRAGMAAYWPDCPWPLTVIDDPTDGGYTARLLRHLQARTSDVVVLNYDDFILRSPVDSARAMQAVERGVALGASLVTLSHNRLITQAPFPDMPGWFLYSTKQEPFYGRFHFSWLAVRRDRAIEILQKTLTMILPRQDVDWTGAYNLELYGGTASLPYVAVGPSAEAAPLNHANAVIQERWCDAGLALIKRFRLDIDPRVRGVYQPSAGMDHLLAGWERARAS
jgi:hypothetical protein